MQTQRTATMRVRLQNLEGLMNGSKGPTSAEARRLTWKRYIRRGYDFVPAHSQ